MSRSRNRSWSLGLLLLLWLAVYGLACARPPLLDDADSTHAEAAQAMLRTSDWVTLRVDGVRYLEKPPLPYWIAALSMKSLGENAFAVHLPLALTVLLLALLARSWAAEVFGDTAGDYAALMTLTSAGVFLFTRVFIPDALLSLLLLVSLRCLERLTRPEPPSWPLLWAGALWLALAGAVLAKGLVALIFFFATALLFLWLSEGFAMSRRLHLVSGLSLFLAVAAPWHILAGLRNTGGADGHGFFWFYFVNEHVLRFLGRRIPRDYNKLPALAYWLLHLVWLFPWSVFLPATLAEGWRARRSLSISGPATRTTLLLTLFSTLVLLFFSLSTNQEYYTFPVYTPLLILVAAVIARTEGRTLQVGIAALSAIGLLAAAALAFGLWSARGLPATQDVGALLAHRGIGQYTLSMSHFFDLTGASFAALRLPAALALVALATGPALAFALARKRPSAAIHTIAISFAFFLIAAHLALDRFAPMLSSEAFAERILQLRASGQISANSRVMIFGDQAFGASIPFYLREPALLVDGRTTSMQFGSTFPDAPPVFLTHEELLKGWGAGERRLLFVPEDQRDAVANLLGARAIPVFEQSRKLLVTDRPLDTASTQPR